jgi:TIGR03009 family protein
VIGGKTYEFCCPPCIDEFVILAKEDPDRLLPPEAYVHGQSVFSHDPASKQQTQTVLPPEMRGKAIADGPLPFLFGADAEQIKQRYWIRPLPMPPDVKGEYWLEAFPKRREDAANYSKVHVIIDHKDFLPKGLVIFDRNFDPASNPARSTFTFEQRESNWSIALQQLKVLGARILRAQGARRLEASGRAIRQPVRSRAVCPRGASRPAAPHDSSDAASTRLAAALNPDTLVPLIFHLIFHLISAVPAARN